jgi:hypothetical protein
LGDKVNVAGLALAHYWRLHPIEMENTNMYYPRWDIRPAQCMLNIDVDNGKHKIYKPGHLQTTRQEEYECFPLVVFHKHIQQDKQSCTDSLYWLTRKVKKRASASKKKTRKMKSRSSKLDEIRLDWKLSCGR